MIGADELERVAPGLFIWHAFDSSSKSELFSTAVRCPQGILVVDPIPLALPALNELLALGPLHGIVITNANHWRASRAWASKLGVAIFGHPSLADTAISQYVPVRHGDQILQSLQVIEINGAAPGEIGLYSPDNHGSLILGDALIHFQPYGFTVLPAKYCNDHKQMRRSLEDLLNYQSKRILFAHGAPILSQARTRLEHLLHAG